MHSEIFHLPFAPLQKEESHPAPRPEAFPSLKERLVLLPKDPHTLFVYWRLSPQKLQNHEKFPFELRLYQLPELHVVQRLEIPKPGSQLYLPVQESGTTYQAELGLKTAENHFVLLLKSNPATLPFGYPAGEKARKKPLDLVYEGGKKR